MSLEEAIVHHAAAIRELALAIRETKGSAVGPSTQPLPGADVKKAKPAKAEAEPEVKVDPKKAEVEDDLPDGQKPEETSLTYDDLKGPFLNLVKSKGREIALAVLEPFGYATLKEVEGKTAAYEKVLAAITKAEA